MGGGWSWGTLEKGIPESARQGPSAGPFPSPLHDNIMLLSDAYKTSHWRQYPPGTTEVYSYFESRGGKFDEVVFFGLQYFLKRYMQGVVVTKEKIDEAERIVNAHVGLGEMKHFNREGWEYILTAHGGKLPLKIKCAPEGMVVPNRNVLMTVVNTDPKCFWLTNYMETMLVQVWYPMTVATQSREFKKIILDYLIKTGCDVPNLPNELPAPLKLISVGYQLNDFGCRGVASMETAALGGCAHLVNFTGSDTMPGLCTAVDYYSLALESCAGTSVPAAEHSTITSWGREGEVDAFRNMLTQYPEGIVAVVSDSYNIYDACEKLWGTELKEIIEKRKAPPGKLVVRPDSGDPKTIVVEVLEKLAINFPPTTNDKGYKVLPPYIRVIQGDGISYESVQEILANMEKSKWAAENVCFGSGGALLQKMDRDTQKCAFKCCEIIVDGKARNVYKDPITDQGKKSKQGRLKLVNQGGSLTTLTEGQGDEADDLLVEVFNNGIITKFFPFESVRLMAEKDLVAQIFDVKLPGGGTIPPTIDSKGLGNPFKSPLHDNIMLLSDSYKTSHWRQYPPGTTEVYSYFESRGGKFDEVCFFGLQYFLKRYLQGVVVTKEKIDEAERIVNAHMGLGEMKHFNREGWEHILNAHGGKLPIKICAAPEGMVIPVKNVLMTVVNTDPKSFWLTNYLETMLVQVWYPMTVATQSREQKKVILDYLIKTGCDLPNMPNKLPAPLKLINVGYQLNDFGCRGVSSMETAAVGGCAHLVNFAGSDTMPGLCTAIDYYSLSLEQCSGTSVPAAEHSTITSWGREAEVDAFRNMLTQYPEGIVAVVSDSYNIYDACEKLWGTELKEIIEKRKAPPGKLVVRPDSGDPKTIVVEVLEKLAINFPPTTNDKGYKVLPPFIRVIQGDGISYESLQEILANMEKSKWAAENVCFGSGGALLQKMDRDTQKCAFKCCEIIVDGKARNVYKDPITDKGKKSKQGRLKLVKQGGSLTTLTEGQGDPKDDLLVEVFNNGTITRTFDFNEVRATAERELVVPIFDISPQ